MNLRRIPIYLLFLLLLLSCSREKVRLSANDRKPMYRSYKQVAFDHDVRGVREIQVYDHPNRPEEVPVLRDTLAGWSGQSFAITIDQEVSAQTETDSLLTRRDGFARLFVYKYYPISYHVSIDHGGNEIHTITFSTSDLLKACWQTMEKLEENNSTIKHLRDFTEEGLCFRDIVLLPELSNGIHPMILRYNSNHADLLLAGISGDGVKWCLSTSSYEPEQQIQFCNSHHGILLGEYLIDMEGEVTNVARLQGFNYVGGLPLHDKVILWYDADADYEIMPGERKKTLTYYRILDMQGNLLDSFAINAKSNRFEGCEYIWYDTTRKTVHLLSQSFDSLYMYTTEPKRTLVGQAKNAFLSGAPIVGKEETEIRFFNKQKFKSYLNTKTGKIRIAF